MKRHALVFVLAFQACGNGSSPQDLSTSDLSATDSDQGVPDLSIGTDLLRADLRGVDVDAGPSCSDHMKNGSETDIDCGGGSCPACANGLSCAAFASGPRDCMSGICSNTTHVCVATVCSDQVLDGTETDIDCGGSCSPCGLGKMCVIGSRDCTSGVCSTMTHVCVATQCQDQLKDGAETDVDCGGGTCSPCAAGKGCGVPSDCTTGFCNGGLCVSCVPATNCTSPPANVCASQTQLSVYPNPGACAAPLGSCDYSATTTQPCANGCFGSACNGTPSFAGDAAATSLGGTVTLDKEQNLNASTGSAPAGATVKVTIATRPNNGYQSLTLKWTNNDFSSTTPVSMTLTSQLGGVDTWTATIPAQPPATTVRFSIDALRWDGATHDASPVSSTYYTYVATGVTLTTTVLGIGTVTSTPAGINCSTGNSGTCSAGFSPGSIQLTAGTGFKGWGSGPCGAAPTTTPCSFALSSATSQAAAFYAALSLGVGDRATVADNSALDSYGATTIETWATLTQTTASTNSHVALVQKGQAFAASNPVGYQLGYYFDGTNFFPELGIAILKTGFSAGTATLSCRSTTAVGPSAQAVHHLAGQWDPSSNGVLRLFVDGQQVCSVVDNQAVDAGPSGPPLVSSTSALYIGTPPAETNRFSGVVDELRITNGVLYTASFTPVRHPTALPATVGLWHFDDGSGTSAVDSSSTNATATLSAGATWTTEP